MTSTKPRNWKTKAVAFGCVHPVLCWAGDALMLQAPKGTILIIDILQLNSIALIPYSTLWWTFAFIYLAGIWKTLLGWIVEIHLFGESVFYSKVENTRYLVFQHPLKLRTSYVTYLQINQRCTQLRVWEMTWNSLWWQNSGRVHKKINEQ